MRASGAVLRIHPMRARLHAHRGRIRLWWGAVRDTAGGLLGIVWIVSWGLLLLTTFSLGELSKRLESRGILPPTVSSAADQPVASEDHVHHVP